MGEHTHDQKEQESPLCTYFIYKNVCDYVDVSLIKIFEIRNARVSRNHIKSNVFERA